MSWQEWIQLAATVVAAVAAVGAIVFAWRTVLEAKSLRRATRTDRILDCIVNYSEALTSTLGRGGDASIARVSAARFQLRAALAVKTPLPRCSELMDDRQVNISSTPATVRNHVSAALGEVAGLRGAID